MALGAALRCRGQPQVSNEGRNGGRGVSHLGGFLDTWKKAPRKRADVLLLCEVGAKPLFFRYFMERWLHCVDTDFFKINY